MNKKKKKEEEENFACYSLHSSSISVEHYLLLSCRRQNEYWADQQRRFRNTGRLSIQIKSTMWLQAARGPAS
jgi:hypothetical protein